MMSDEPITAGLHPALTDEQIDELERTAARLIDACEAQDYDAAYIIAASCENTAMLAAFTTEMLLSMFQDGIE